MQKTGDFVGKTAMLGGPQIGRTIFTNPIGTPVPSSTAARAAKCLAGSNQAGGVFEDSVDGRFVFSAPLGGCSKNALSKARGVVFFPHPKWCRISPTKSSHGI